MLLLRSIKRPSPSTITLISHLIFAGFHLFYRDFGTARIERYYCKRYISDSMDVEMFKAFVSGYRDALVEEQVLFF